MLNNFWRSSLLMIVALTLAACQKASAPTPQATQDSLGVGPVTQPLNIPQSIDLSRADRGKSIFESKCTACHKIEARYVGPALAGITQRRRPEWIMNMILNPTEMTQKDSVAKALLAEYLAQMANQNISLDEARDILEYFRHKDAGK